MFQENPRQSIHMKNQALFSLKDKSKKLKCCLLQFLFGALRVKCTDKKILKCVCFYWLVGRGEGGVSETTVQ